jgi:broad specificity phosphatase PhoE
MKKYQVELTVPEINLIRHALTLLHAAAYWGPYPCPYSWRDLTDDVKKLLAHLPDFHTGAV